MERRRNSDLTGLKKGLQAADTIELPVDEAYYEHLHDNIMAAIEKTEMAPAPMYSNSYRYWRAHWKDWFYPAGGISSVFFIMFMISGHLAQFNQTMQRAGLFSDGVDRIAMEASSSPEKITQTLINTQSESDFFMDVASESFDHLSNRDLFREMGVKHR